MQVDEAVQPLLVALLEMQLDGIPPERVVDMVHTLSKSKALCLLWRQPLPDQVMALVDRLTSVRYLLSSITASRRPLLDALLRMQFNYYAPVHVAAHVSALSDSDALWTLTHDQQVELMAETMNGKSAAADAYYRFQSRIGIGDMCEPALQLAARSRLADEAAQAARTRHARGQPHRTFIFRKYVQAKYELRLKIDTSPTPPTPEQLREVRWFGMYGPPEFEEFLCLIADQQLWPFFVSVYKWHRELEHIAFFTRRTRWFLCDPLSKRISENVSLFRSSARFVDPETSALHLRTARALLARVAVEAALEVNVRQTRLRVQHDWLRDEATRASATLNRAVQMKDLPFDWITFRKLDLLGDVLRDESVPIVDLPVVKFLEDVAAREGNNFLCHLVVKALAQRCHFHYREQNFLQDPFTSNTPRYVAAMKLFADSSGDEGRARLFDLTQAAVKSQRARDEEQRVLARLHADQLRREHEALLRRTAAHVEAQRLAKVQREAIADRHRSRMQAANRLARQSAPTNHASQVSKSEPEAKKFDFDATIMACKEATSEQQVFDIVSNALSATSAVAMHDAATALHTRADLRAAESELQCAQAESGDASLHAPDEAASNALVARVRTLQQILADASNAATTARRWQNCLMHVATTRRALLKARAVRLERGRTLADLQGADSAHVHAARQAVDAHDALVAALDVELHAPPMILVKDADAQRVRRLAVKEAFGVAAGADKQLNHVLVHIGKATRALLKARAVRLERGRTLADLQGADSAHVHAARQAVDAHDALVAALEVELHAPPMILVKDADAQRARRLAVKEAFVVAVAADHLVSVRLLLDGLHRTLVDLQSVDSPHVSAALEAVNTYVALGAALEAELSAPPTLVADDAIAEAADAAEATASRKFVSRAVNDASVAAAAAERRLLHVVSVDRALVKAQAELAAHEQALTALPGFDCAALHDQVRAVTQFVVHASTEYIAALTSELGAPPLDDVPHDQRVRRRRRIARTRLDVYKIGRRLAKLVTSTPRVVDAATTAAEEVGCAPPLDCSPLVLSIPQLDIGPELRLFDLRTSDAANFLLASELQSLALDALVFSIAPLRGDVLHSVPSSGSEERAAKTGEQLSLEICFLPDDRPPRKLAWDDLGDHFSSKPLLYSSTCLTIYPHLDRNWLPPSYLTSPVLFPVTATESASSGNTDEKRPPSLPPSAAPAVCVNQFCLLDRVQVPVNMIVQMPLDRQLHSQVADYLATEITTRGFDLKQPVSLVPVIKLSGGPPLVVDGVTVTDDMVATWLSWDFKGATGRQQEAVLKYSAERLADPEFRKLFVADPVAYTSVFLALTFNHRLCALKIIDPQHVHILHVFAELEMPRSSEELGVRARALNQTANAVFPSTELDAVRSMIRTIDNCVGDLRARNEPEFNLRVYREYLYFTDNDLDKRREIYLSEKEVKADSKLLAPRIPALAARCVATQEKENPIFFTRLVRAAFVRDAKFSTTNDFERVLVPTSFQLWAVQDLLLKIESAESAWSRCACLTYRACPRAGHGSAIDFHSAPVMAQYFPRAMLTHKNGLFFDFFDVNTKRIRQSPLFDFPALSRDLPDHASIDAMRGILVRALFAHQRASCIRRGRKVAPPPTCINDDDGPDQDDERTSSSSSSSSAARVATRRTTSASAASSSRAADVSSDSLPACSCSRVLLDLFDLPADRDATKTIVDTANKHLGSTDRAFNVELFTAFFDCTAPGNVLASVASDSSDKAPVFNYKLGALLTTRVLMRLREQVKSLSHDGGSDADKNIERVLSLIAYTDMVDKIAKAARHEINTPDEVNTTVAAICTLILLDTATTPTASRAASDDDGDNDDGDDGDGDGGDDGDAGDDDGGDGGGHEDDGADDDSGDGGDGQSASGKASVKTPPSRAAKVKASVKASVKPSVRPSVKPSAKSSAEASVKKPVPASLPLSSSAAQKTSRDARQNARANSTPQAPLHPSSSPSCGSSASALPTEALRDDLLDKLRRARKHHHPFYDEKVYKHFAKHRHDRAYAHATTEKAPLEAFFDDPNSEFATRVSADSVRGMNRPRCAKFRGRRLESDEDHRVLVMRLVASVLREQCDAEERGESSPNVAGIQSARFQILFVQLLNGVDNCFKELTASEHQRLRNQFLENIRAAVAALCYDSNAWKYDAVSFFRVMRLVWPSELVGLCVAHPQVGHNDSPSTFQAVAVSSVPPGCRAVPSTMVLFSDYLAFFQWSLELQNSFDRPADYEEFIAQRASMQAAGDDSLDVLATIGVLTPQMIDALSAPFYENGATTGDGQVFSWAVVHFAPENSGHAAASFSTDYERTVREDFTEAVLLDSSIDPVQHMHDWVRSNRHLPFDDFVQQLEASRGLIIRTLDFFEFTMPTEFFDPGVRQMQYTAFTVQELPDSAAKILEGMSWCLHLNPTQFLGLSKAFAAAFDEYCAEFKKKHGRIPLQMDFMNTEAGKAIKQKFVRSRASARAQDQRTHDGKGNTSEAFGLVAVKDATADAFHLRLVSDKNTAAQDLQSLDGSCKFQLVHFKLESRESYTEAAEARSAAAAVAAAASSVPSASAALSTPLVDNDAVTALSFQEWCMALQRSNKKARTAASSSLGIIAPQYDAKAADVALSSTASSPLSPARLPLRVQLWFRNNCWTVGIDLLMQLARPQLLPLLHSLQDQDNEALMYLGDLYSVLSDELEQDKYHPDVRLPPSSEQSRDKSGSADAFDSVCECLASLPASMRAFFAFQVTTSFRCSCNLSHTPTVHAHNALSLTVPDAVPASRSSSSSSSSLSSAAAPSHVSMQDLIDAYEHEEGPLAIQCNATVHQLWQVYSQGKGWADYLNQGNNAARFTQLQDLALQYNKSPHASPAKSAALSTSTIMSMSQDSTADAAPNEADVDAVFKSTQADVGGLQIVDIAKRDYLDLLLGVSVAGEPSNGGVYPDVRAYVPISKLLFAVLNQVCGKEIVRNTRISAVSEFACFELKRGQTADDQNKTPVDLSHTVLVGGASYGLCLCVCRFGTHFSAFATHDAGGASLSRLDNLPGVPKTDVNIQDLNSFAIGGVASKRKRDSCAPLTLLACEAATLVVYKRIDTSMTIEEADENTSDDDNGDDDDSEYHGHGNEDDMENNSRDGNAMTGVTSATTSHLVETRLPVSSCFSCFCAKGNASTIVNCRCKLRFIHKACLESADFDGSYLPRDQHGQWARTNWQCIDCVEAALHLVAPPSDALPLERFLPRRVAQYVKHVGSSEHSLVRRSQLAVESSTDSHALVNEAAARLLFSLDEKPFFDALNVKAACQNPTAFSTIHSLAARDDLRLCPPWTQIPYPTRNKNRLALAKAMQQRRIPAYADALDYRYADCPECANNPALEPGGVTVLSAYESALIDYCDTHWQCADFPGLQVQPCSPQRNSLRQELGVFATHALLAGTVLCSYEGSVDWSREHTHDELPVHDSVFKLLDTRDWRTGIIVSQLHRANLGRFFNSAPKAKANAVAVRRVHRGRVRIFIVLVRDVKIGDEIVFPYGPEFEIEDATNITAEPIEAAAVEAASESAKS